MQTAVFPLVCVFLLVSLELYTDRTMLTSADSSTVAGPLLLFSALCSGALIPNRVPLVPVVLADSGLTEPCLCHCMCEQHWVSGVHRWGHP